MRQIEKKVMSKAVNTLMQSSRSERIRKVAYKKGSAVMHRKLIIEEVNFEFNDDIAKVVQKFTQAFSRHVCVFDDEESTGLIEGDAIGVFNRLKRGFNAIAGSDNRSGRSITIPHSEFYLNEKSRGVYEHYAIFLLNVLHKMGFASEYVVRSSHQSDNSNKFIFIVSLLQWLAASALSQHEELGLTTLLDVFAGDLLLESKLLAKKGWLGASCSSMYSALIEKQPEYIQLIKARRAEEQLSKTAIKSINDGLDLLDDHEKIGKCFLLAKVNSVYKQLQLTPKDLDDKAFKASYHRLGLQFLGEEACLQSVSVEQLQFALQLRPDYRSSQRQFNQLFDLLKDIAVLRRMLNALASLHETTGWLIIGLSSSVNMKALQSAFNCFHQRFQQASPVFQSILKEMNVDSRCVSIHTELQKVWAKRSVGKINLQFENMCSEGVLSYVRQEIEGALLAINKAQGELLVRGLSQENVFLETHPFYLPIENPSPVIYTPPVPLQTYPPCGFSLGLAFLVVSLSTATVVGLLYLTAFLNITVPPIALIVAVCVLAVMFFAIANRWIKKSEPETLSSAEFQPVLNGAARQALTAAIEPLEKQLDNLKCELQCAIDEVDESSHRNGVEKIKVFFSQFNVLSSPCANDDALWRLISQCRNAAMANPRNKQRYSEGLMLSTAIARRDATDLAGAVKCLMESGAVEGLTSDFSPVVF